MNEGEDHRGADGDDGDHLAAEYALGVLDAVARREAERRMARDPAFAAEVVAWQERLTLLTEFVVPVRPPSGVWRRIEAAIDAETAPKGMAAEPRRGLWHNLSFWRGLAFGSLGLAAASLAGLAVVLPRLQPAAPLVARLAPESGPAVFVAAFDPAERRLVVVPAALSGPEPRVPELWLIPPGGTPRSLGLLDPARPISVSIPPDLQVHAAPQATLAISLEPPGGAPAGVPTGPVIAQGRLQKL